MASLSSKRKAFTNRQLQQRNAKGKPAAKLVTASIVAVAQPAADAGFDHALYQSARARFEAAAVTCEEGDVRQMMRALVQQEFDAGGREGALQMRPYIVKYVGERGAARSQA